MIYVITGPTCLGKTDSAIFLAKHFDAEIVNGDAFQCYKEMNIGVAKPSLEQFSEAPHHLYSFVDIDHDYSIAEYQKVLRDKIEELSSKGKDIIIVGGSGLYIRSALYDYEFKQQSEVDMSKYLSLTNEELHDILTKIDSKEAEKIHTNNRKRMLRAIEIYLSEGETKTDLISKQEHKLKYPAKFFVRDLDRDVLYERINKRVDEMIDLGLLDEVKSLFEKYGTEQRSLQAIGYKEFILYFSNKLSFEETVELIKKNTRNYAKRQMTYIRHQFPVIFYKDNNDLLEKIING